MKVLCISLEGVLLKALKDQSIYFTKWEGTSDELALYLQTDELVTACICDFRHASLPLQIVSELREQEIDIPFLGIADYRLGEPRAEFLERGGDDLFGPRTTSREILASLHSIFRRVKHITRNFHEFVSEDDRVQINLDVQTVKVNGNPIHLTQRKFDLLALLASQPYKIFTKEAILDAFYPGGREHWPRDPMKTIEVFVCQLRRNIDGQRVNSIIETVRGKKGYKINTSRKAISHSAILETA